MKLKAVALECRFKLQFGETHCSLRICCIPYLWIVWAPVLRACCGNMTGKYNYYRMMASCQAQVYVGTLSLQAYTHHRIKGQIVICLSLFQPFSHSRQVVSLTSLGGAYFLYDQDVQTDSLVFTFYNIHTIQSY